MIKFILWFGFAFLGGFLVREFFLPTAQAQTQGGFNPVRRAVALAHYAELSQDWRLHAGDIWKYLIAVFTIHVGVYAKIDLFRGEHPVLVFWFLLAVVIGMAIAALKSRFLAEAIAEAKKGIEQYLGMMTASNVGRLSRWNRIFPRRSTLHTVIILVYLLIIIDYYVLLDP